MADTTWSDDEPRPDWRQSRYADLLTPLAAPGGNGALRAPASAPPYPYEGDIEDVAPPPPGFRAAPEPPRFNGAPPPREPAPDEYQGWTPPAPEERRWSSTWAPSWARSASSGAERANGGGLRPAEPPVPEPDAGFPPLGSVAAGAPTDSGSTVRFPSTPPAPVPLPPTPPPSSGPPLLAPTSGPPSSLAPSGPPTSAPPVLSSVPLIPPAPVRPASGPPAPDGAEASSRANAPAYPPLPPPPSNLPPAASWAPQWPAPSPSSPPPSPGFGAPTDPLSRPVSGGGLPAPGEVVRPSQGDLRGTEMPPPPAASAGRPTVTDLLGRNGRTEYAAPRVQPPTANGGPAAPPYPGSPTPRADAVPPAPQAYAGEPPRPIAEPPRRADAAEPLHPSDAGRPSDLSRPSEAGRSSDLSRPADLGRPSEAGRSSDLSRLADLGRPSEAGRPSSLGRPSEAGRSSDLSRPADLGRPSEAGRPSDLGRPSDPLRLAAANRAVDGSRAPDPLRRVDPLRPADPGRPSDPNRAGYAPAPADPARATDAAEPPRAGSRSVPTDTATDGAGPRTEPPPPTPSAGNGRLPYPSDLIARTVGGGGATAPTGGAVPGGSDARMSEADTDGAESLPQRVPAEPDVPTAPEPPSDQPAGAPQLARIATHLRRDDVPPVRERPEGFDVKAILAAVQGVTGVRDASLRKTPAGAHSLRLDLADGADPAEVSRQVARLLQDRMGLAAAPQNLPADTPPGWLPQEPPIDVPRRRRGETHRGRASVVSSRPEPATPSEAAFPPFGGAAGAIGTVAGSPVAASTQSEAPASRPLNPGLRPGPRVVIDHVQVSTFGLDATVEVRFAVGDVRASGVATGPAVDNYVLRLCAVAAASAIDQLLRSSGQTVEQGRCFVENAAVVPFGNCEVAVVVVLLTCGGWVEQLAGSALVAGDPRQAVVRATLDAVNRRLEALLT